MGACPLPEGAAGTAPLDTGYVPVALSKSEGAGSVRTLVHLPGAHLYIQVLGNKEPTAAVVPPHDPPQDLCKTRAFMHSTRAARHLVGPPLAA